MSSLPPIDRAYLTSLLPRLMAVPTDVPLGLATLMEPDDPKLVHYVQEVVRPELYALGAHDLIDAGRNNLVARVGQGTSGRSLLLLTYTVTQHHNLMADPFPGKIANGAAYGFDEPCAFGQGVSQNKAHLAVALTVLKLLRDEGIDLRGRLYLGINNEGRSSHACTNTIVGALDRKPDACILLTKSDFGIQLGNRGRVDAIVTVRGKATHSSRPHLGHSAIDGANEVINRIKAMRFTKQHEILGGQHAVVYQVSYDPLAPHTLPETAKLLVDRRLLPGDDPDEAVAEIRAAIGEVAPYEVTVERGVYMLPSLIDPNDPLITDLSAAYQAVTGEPARTFYAGGTYDAGGPTSHGIPSVMFGASGGDWPLGIDYLPLSKIVAEAQIVAKLVLETLA
ncbi:MAG: M20/M25/M40 family metallo-hydrolase [Chloroflexi bacterium]|nr:M20/M25/M40 family metallo-hydrolase [Chloroflexota bacterium]